MSTEKDSGSYSQSNTFSPVPSQLQLPFSPDVQKTVGFSQPHEIFENLADFVETDTILEEDTTICESDDSEETVKPISPPKTFIETQQKFLTQASNFTQIMKQKKPIFQSENDDEEYKLNPDYEHDKDIHTKKLKLVHKELSKMRCRYYVYNPMLRDTRTWDSQTKNGYYDGPAQKIRFNPENENTSQKSFVSQGVQTSQEFSTQISTQISPHSSPLPVPIFDTNTPDCTQLESSSEKIEQDAKSQDYYKITTKKICPSQLTPPNDFLNSPKQTRMYTTNTQVIKSEQTKRKEPEDSNKENNFKKKEEEPEVTWKPYSFLNKKPKFKQGAGLSKRITKSLHFKTVKK